MNLLADSLAMRALLILININDRWTYPINILNKY